MSISWIEILCKQFFIFLPGIPDRQADYKLRSLSQRAMHRDASAMAFGNPSGNGKPQPGAIGVFATGFRSPKKSLKQLCQLCLLYAAAVIPTMIFTPSPQDKTASRMQPAHSIFILNRNFK